MGCILGVCAAQAACCCCGAACNFCCSCCPSSVSSIMTRLMYLVLIVIGILTSSVFLIPSVKETMSKSTGIPFYDKTFCEIAGVGKQCEKAIGFQSIYRVWFAYAMFFLLMALLTIGVKSSKDCRAMWHNGFWFFKILIVIALTVAAFFIPEDPFTEVWMYIGLIGGVLFVFVQVVYLIEFAHSTTERLLRSGESKGHYCLFLIIALVLYGLAIAGVVGMVTNFTTSSACNLNKGIISVNVILCVVITVLSILPKVQAANHRSGILQSGIVSVYVIYLTFSALSDEPTGIGSTYCPYNLSNISGAGTAMLAAGIVIAMVTVCYVSFKMAHSDVVIIEDEESATQKVSDDEEEATQYSYWLFHVLCLLVSLYCMMVMTNWFQPTSVNDGYTFSPSWPSMWIQVVASWLCLGIYIWTLFAPIVAPERFSNDI